MDRAWSDRLEELSRAVQRMSLVGAQDALIFHFERRLDYQEFSISSGAYYPLTTLC